MTIRMCLRIRYSALGCYHQFERFWVDRVRWWVCLRMGCGDNILCGYQAMLRDILRWVCGYTIVLFCGGDSKVCRCVQSRVVMVVLGGDTNVGGVFKCWSLGMWIYRHVVSGR